MTLQPAIVILLFFPIVIQDIKYSQHNKSTEMQLNKLHKCLTVCCNESPRDYVKVS